MRKHWTILLAMIVCGIFTSAAQNRITIKGEVFDENNEPFIGVMIANMTQKTGLTSEDGTFSIDAAEGDIISITCLGYIPHEFSVGKASQNVRIVMKKEKLLLDEVVVVGYGSQKKADLTGAVASVQFSEALATRNQASLSSGLAGLATGLSVIQNSGMAGADEASLMIRGIGTVNNAAPLIVVDDMPDVDINLINMEDVESISVLKDASAAAIYGSRAANGAILVTTKSGRSKDAQIKFNFSKSIDTPVNPYDFMEDYARAMHLYQQRGDMSKYRDLVYFKDGTIDEWLAMQHVDELRYPGTDWWDIIMRTGSTTKASISVTGGEKAMKVYSSFSWLDKQGLQIYNDYTRYNARVNLTFDIKKNLKFSVKADGSWGKQHYYSETGFGSEILQYAIAGITPFDESIGKYGGTMAYGEDVSTVNPLALYENSVSQKLRKQVNGSANLSWTPIRTLSVQVNAGLLYSTDFMKKAASPVQAYNFQTGTNIDYWYIPSNEGVHNNTSESYKTQWDIRATYEKKWKKHQLKGILIYSEEYWNKRFQNSYRRDRIHPSLSELDATLTGYQQTSGYSSEEGLRSVVGRINYNAFKRYLLEVNFRADGSSKFADGHKWGFFPSASLGWRFSEESFIKKALGRFLANGKLRVSYGTLGNNSGVGLYEQLLTLANMNYVVNNEVVKGFVDRKLTNKDLSWETSKVFNAGVDLAFFRGRLSFEFDYYDRLTEGMIRPSDLSDLLSGAYDAPRHNMGNLRNRGLEANLTWKNDRGALRYKLNFNVSYNRSRLESWSEYLPKGTRYVGMPWGYTYGYLDYGIVNNWQTVINSTPQSARPGDILRVDVNGDGQVNEEDMVAYADYTNLRPPLDFGFGGDFSWKGIDFTFLFTGSWGRRDYWLNAYNNTAFPEGGYAVSDLHYNNLWNVNNRDASMNRMGGNNRYDSSYYLDDMSFIRLKNAQIGYTLPKSILKKVDISSLRFYVSGENLFTITSYRGMDPERIGNKSDVYPQLRSYTFGVSVNF